MYTRDKTERLLIINVCTLNIIENKVLFGLVSKSYKKVTRTLKLNHFYFRVRTIVNKLTRPAMEEQLSENAYSLNS